MSWPQIIKNLDIFKDFFVGKIVLAANLHYPENIQSHFGLENCLRSKSSLSWKYSKTFSPANLSYAQIIIILKIFNDFFACKNALAANHHYPENIQRLFCLQNCLSRKTSLSWKYWKTFSPAKLSFLQILLILKIFKYFFACKIVFDAKHHYPEDIQRLFRQQSCLFCKSSLSWKYSKTFSPAKLSSTQLIIILKTFKTFGRQNCLSRKTSLSWKFSKIFSPAKLP